MGRANEISSRLRLALYSHDAQGLGHIRRNLNIANSLIRSGLDVTVLLICGSRKIAHFDFEDSVDTLVLPALRKSRDGRYQPRNLRIEQSRLLKLRQSAITAALADFNPHLLIVDKLPLGFRGELQPALELMNQRGRTCILGLRDIIDSPQAAWEEWLHSDGGEAVQHYYQQVWIYGDQSVYDLSRDYHFPDHVLRKTVFTGYLNPLDLCESHPDEAAAAGDVDQHGREQTILCLLGGGQDGYELSKLFLKCKLGERQRGILVTGPFMSADHRQKLIATAQNRGRFEVIKFRSSLLPLIQKADLIISLGGYNTMCEIVGLNVPALIIPRVQPRQEQLVRAQVFHRLGLVDYIHPDEVSAEALTHWIQRDDHKRPQDSRAIDFSGFATIRTQIESLLLQKV